MPQSEVKINPHKHSPSLLTELQFLVQPLFPDNACGADPRYTPEFDAIRLEIEKPSGADFQKVFLNCETLLMNHTRDMRVLGYYLLASAKVKGIGYFCQTLSAYYYIINSHWDALHPARPAARQNALKWLNQERIVSLLQQVDLLPQDLTFINDGYMAIKGINSIIQDIWPDETPSLGAIIKLIKTWVSQVPAGTIQEMTESDSGPEPITGPVPVVDEAATSDQITPKPEPSSELPPPAWVCEILTPLNGPFPCGSDPKYTPEYDIIKTEIEKPSNINFPLIAGNCQRVLTRHSKDIRVAGFYILALAKTQGAESFLWGLYSYSTLITTYLNDIYPQREMARINAIKWLNQDKLIQLTSPLPLEGVNIELIKATISKVAALSGYIEQNFNGQSPSMGNITRLLNTWLKQKEKSIPKPVESAVPTPAIAPHLFTPSASVNTVTSVNADPQNESDALALLRQGAGFLLDSAPQNPLGYKTTIALRWHTVTQLPPSVDQITKIAGPNSKRADFFEATCQSSNWPVLLEQALLDFSKPGMHFWLDLINYIYQALAGQGGGLTECALTVEGEARAFINKFPDLMNLKFQSQIPLANSRTREWLNTPDAAQAGISPSAQAADNGLESDMEAAAVMARSGRLPEALNYLEQGIRGTDQKAFTMRMMAMADLCLQNSKCEIADAILEKLQSNLTSLPIFSWDKDFAQAFYTLHIKTMKVLAQGSSLTKEEKGRIMGKLRESQKDLIKLDYHFGLNS